QELRLDIPDDRRGCRGRPGAHAPGLRAHVARPGALRPLRLPSAHAVPPQGTLVELGRPTAAHAPLLRRGLVRKPLPPEGDARRSAADERRRLNPPGPYENFATAFSMIESAWSTSASSTVSGGASRTAFGRTLFTISPFCRHSRTTLSAMSWLRVIASSR